MIDAKTLHIGSHVNLDNKRAKIVCLEPYSKVFPCSVVVQRNGLPVVYHLDDMRDIEPIPITEELLTELGFVKEALPHLPFELVRYIDGESARCREVHKSAVVVPRITLDYTGRILTPFWQATVLDDKMTQCRADINYLHELENFVYLTIKTELVKE